MAISSVSVTFSVMVLNVRYGGECRRGVPNWLRFLAFRILAPIVCYRTNEYRLRKWFNKQADFQKAFLAISLNMKSADNRVTARELDESPKVFDRKTMVHFGAQNHCGADNGSQKSKSVAKSLSINDKMCKAESCSNAAAFGRILSRVNKLTDKLERDFKSEEMFAEWRKVSHIFDLFFFGLIVFITLSVTLAMLVFAPMFSSLDILAKRRQI